MLMKDRQMSIKSSEPETNHLTSRLPEALEPEPSPPRTRNPRISKRSAVKLCPGALLFRFSRALPTVFGIAPPPRRRFSVTNSQYATTPTISRNHQPTTNRQQPTTHSSVGSTRTIIPGYLPDRIDHGGLLSCYSQQTITNNSLVIIRRE